MFRPLGWVDFRVPPAGWVDVRDPTPGWVAFRVSPSWLSGCLLVCPGGVPGGYPGGFPGRSPGRGAGGERGVSPGGDPEGGRVGGREGRGGKRIAASVTKGPNIVVTHTNAMSRQTQATEEIKANHGNAIALAEPAP